MKLNHLFEAKTNHADTRDQLLQLFDGLTTEQVVNGLVKVLTLSQIDGLVDALGLGTSKEDVEFMFKMLMKGLPSELKTKMDEEPLSRNRVVDAITGTMSLFNGRPKTEEESRLYKMGFIWFMMYYADGKWRVTYDCWQDGEVKYVQTTPMEPAAFLTFMKKQVQLQTQLYEKEFAALTARKAARKEARAKK
jgi:hypothetical protein